MENMDKKIATRKRLSDNYKEKSKEKNRKDKQDKIEILVERLNSHTHLRGISDEIVKSLIKKIENMDKEPNRSDTIVLDFLKGII